MLKEDYKVNNVNFLRLITYVFTMNPFYLVVLYRLSSWLHKKHIRFIPSVIRAISIMLYSADISPAAQIGSGLRIAHSTGIVIGHGTVIGKNAHIFQNVTVGSSNSNDNGRVMPIIGDNVSLFAGSVIIGAIRLGDNCSVGANAVVTKDFPDNVIIAGVPGRIIGTIDITSSIKCATNK